jgi:hypothetical protein
MRNIRSGWPNVASKLTRIRLAGEKQDLPLGCVGSHHRRVDCRWSKVLPNVGPVPMVLGVAQSECSRKVGVFGNNVSLVVPEAILERDPNAISSRRGDDGASKQEKAQQNPCTGDPSSTNQLWADVAVCLWHGSSRIRNCGDAIQSVESCRQSTRAPSLPSLGYSSGRWRDLAGDQENTQNVKPPNPFLKSRRYRKRRLR